MRLRTIAIFGERSSASILLRFRQVSSCPQKNRTSIAGPPTSRSQFGDVDRSPIASGLTVCGIRSTSPKFAAVRLEFGQRHRIGEPMKEEEGLNRREMIVQTGIVVGGAMIPLPAEAQTTAAPVPEGQLSSLTRLEYDTLDAI